jgi:hypothetical protein
VERLDAALDPPSGLTVGRAWRVLVAPDVVAGRLLSRTVVVVADAGPRLAMHQVSGRVEVEG